MCILLYVEDNEWVECECGQWIREFLENMYIDGDDKEIFHTFYLNCIANVLLCDIHTSISISFCMEWYQLFMKKVRLGRTKNSLWELPKKDVIANNMYMYATLKDDNWYGSLIYGNWVVHVQVHKVQ